MKKIRYAAIVLLLGMLAGYMLGYGQGQSDTYKKKTDDVTLLDIYTDN